ncbi:hypothetical protein Krac_6965 [Ktedonobacter racemifer DSM 44963]|uniref:Uncharacterized protein n=1 Tax=Ktedonobacter racemifer DSM 44963 TaxID=485913 RepID=D6TQ83_KTERA|nr:hypothetical protein Krac_6965 [Ktedonobacter racemifer DSM 44963]
MNQSVSADLENVAYRWAHHLLTLYHTLICQRFTPMERLHVIRFLIDLCFSRAPRKMVCMLSARAITPNHVQIQPRRRWSDFPRLCRDEHVTGSAFFSLVNQIPEFLRCLARVSSHDACSVE